jgi:hypothetical protein
MALNHRFKQIVSAWQLAAGEPSDADWQALVDDVATVHAQLQPVLLQTTSQVPRLGAYRRRFDAAMDGLRQGDRSMLASPIKESYHTVWFEYHEELIVLCGRNRAAEEQEHDAAPMPPAAS